MATTGVLDSGFCLVYVAGVPISKSTDATLSYSLGVREVTNKDSANTVENLPANKSFEISSSAFYTFDATLAADDFYTYMFNRTEVTVLFGRTETKTAGNFYYSGKGYITSMSINTPNEGDSATYDLTITGTGALTKYAIT
jgi:hypothetical protein